MLHSLINKVKIMEQLSTFLQTPAFNNLSEEDLVELLFDDQKKIKPYHKGNLIKMQGEECRGLHVLVEGTVRCTMGSSEGKSITVEVLKAPALLAPAFIFATNNHFPVSVWAEEDCKVVFIGREQLMRFMSKNTLFMQNFMKVISNRCAYLSSRLNDFAVTGLKQRILNYIDKNGTLGNQSDAAHHLGVARPSLSRALGELERDGLLER